MPASFTLFLVTSFDENNIPLRARSTLKNAINIRNFGNDSQHYCRLENVLQFSLLFNSSDIKVVVSNQTIKLFIHINFNRVVKVVCNYMIFPQLEILIDTK